MIEQEHFLEHLAEVLQYGEAMMIFLGAHADYSLWWKVDPRPAEVFLS